MPRFLKISEIAAHKGEIILKEGYGFADKDKGIKNTPQTNFGIGSITKSMTALYLKFARVIAQFKRLYKIATENSECFAEVSGKLRHDTI